MLAVMRAPVLTSLALVMVMGVGLSVVSIASAQDAVVEEALLADDAAIAVESEEVAEVEEVVAFDAADSAYTINTLIMFICAVLVLFMQAGFAMVEVGLNSAKNTINILAKNVMDLSVGVILFLFIGFALMYPGDNWTVEGYLGTPSARLSTATMWQPPATTARRLTSCSRSLLPRPPRRSFPVRLPDG